jgi:carboxypeptidase C (cathepsin A)
MQIRSLLICLLLAASFCQTSDDDYVRTIIPNYTHNWYSGYFNISGRNEKDIHYIFQESQNDRDNDPLILWVSSFPGCSSVFSMLYEVGAFQLLVPENPSFNISKWAWNMKANLLFLEAPGAGFSTGPTNTSDDQLTLDHMMALT